MQIAFMLVLRPQLALIYGDVICPVCLMGSVVFHLNLSVNFVLLSVAYMLWPVCEIAFTN